VSRHQNTGQYNNIKIANRYFENGTQFKYLETTVTNRNVIRKEMKRKFNSLNSCYRSVQNLLIFRLPSRNIKIRMYKTTILPVVLYGCKTCSLILREENKRVFEGV
jgi:hypothetical protein